MKWVCFFKTVLFWPLKPCTGKTGTRTVGHLTTPTVCQELLRGYWLVRKTSHFEMERAKRKMKHIFLSKRARSEWCTLVQSALSILKILQNLNRNRFLINEQGLTNLLRLIRCTINSKSKSRPCNYSTLSEFYLIKLKQSPEKKAALSRTWLTL